MIHFHLSEALFPSYKNKSHFSKHFLSQSYLLYSLSRIFHIPFDCRFNILLFGLKINFWCFYLHGDFQYCALMIPTSNEYVFLGWLGFPGGSVVKNLPANAGDMGSISGSRRSPGEGNDNPLQYFNLGNSMDRGAWWATVCGVTKIRTWLND